MPLREGISKNVIGSNIAELMTTYQTKGKIGNVTPRNITHAKKIAAAIAYEKAKHKKT